MTELVQFLVRPLVRHPAEVSVSAVDGDASTLLELRLHPADVAVLRASDAHYLRAIQQVLSASGGARKAVLDLVDGDNGEE